MDILEDLYYGNLFPHEKVSKLDDETKELLVLLNRNEEKLIATLSDEQKEIAQLKRELRDAKDALDVLKKAINILGK